MVITQNEQVAKCADMFSTMGTEARLRIRQLSAHPGGLVVGEIQEELDIPNSTLSHHLDKFLQFLYAECCTRNRRSNHKTSFKFANRRP
jgi:ArsR family transcriptional regulator, arsenate/arsenite/antimonite-responsive transcriptional repressor